MLTRTSKHKIPTSNETLLLVHRRHEDEYVKTSGLEASLYISVGRILLVTADCRDGIVAARRKLVNRRDLHHDLLWSEQPSELISVDLEVSAIGEV
jgi:hypothetical protein